MSELETRIAIKIRTLGFDALELTEKDYYAVFWLIAEVSTGSFHRYFYYWGANHAQDAIRALERRRMNWVAGLIRRGMDLFPEGMPNEERGRQKIMNSFSKNQEAVIESITADFYDVVDDIRDWLAQTEEETEA